MADINIPKNNAMSDRVKFKSCSPSLVRDFWLSWLTPIEGVRSLYSDSICVDGVRLVGVWRENGRDDVCGYPV
jgi:hypothetical protein